MNAVPLPDHLHFIAQGVPHRVFPHLKCPRDAGGQQVNACNRI